MITANMSQVLFDKCKNTKIVVGVLLLHVIIISSLLLLFLLNFNVDCVFCLLFFLDNFFVPVICFSCPTAFPAKVDDTANVLLLLLQIAVNNAGVAWNTAMFFS